MYLRKNDPANKSHMATLGQGLDTAIASSLRMIANNESYSQRGRITNELLWRTLLSMQNNAKMRQRN